MNRQLIIRNASFDDEASYECQMLQAKTSCEIKVSECEVKIVEPLKVCVYLHIFKIFISKVDDKYIAR